MQREVFTGLGIVMKNHKIRRNITLLIVFMIEKRHGKYVASWWQWERTPMPVGLPLNYQLIEGFLMVFKRKRKF